MTKRTLRILALVLALILSVTALSACGKKAGTNDTGKTTEQASQPASTEQETAKPASQPEKEPPKDDQKEPSGEQETIEPAKPAGNPITVIDMTGREITLDEPATRVVALSAADCEVLFAIGAGDTLVGRGEYCDYSAEVLDVPIVQSGYDTNIEQIIALQPQVLLMSTMAQTPEQIEALEAAGVHVVVSDAQDIEGVYTAVKMIGALMDKSGEAEKVVAKMKADFDSIKAKVPAQDKKPTVYFEVSPLEYGLWAAGGGTFMNEVADMLGMENVFADMPAWAQISEEQVIERAPDYIVTITMYFGEGDTPEQEIMSRPGWEVIPAVANGHILRMENNELSRPTPRIVDGAQMLYDFVYAAAE